MKRIKYILILLAQISFANVAHSQTAIINMSDVFVSPDNTCTDSWCWLRAIKNTLVHYDINNVTEFDILEYARGLGYFTDTLGNECLECVFPYSCCCKTMGTYKISSILSHYGLGNWLVGANKPPSFFYENFFYNKILIIVLTGHVCIAHGIDDNNMVNIIDGHLNGNGEYTRSINNIYPGRDWKDTYFFYNSPNCSPNVIVGSISSNQGSVVIGASSSIASLSAISPGNDVEFLSGGEVFLKFNANNGFRVRSGSTLKIATNSPYCQ